MPDTILLPIDLQHPESWEKALPAARAMAGATGTIHLLGIVLDIGSSMVATYLPKGFEKQALEAMKDALDDFADQQMPGPGEVPEGVAFHNVRLSPATARPYRERLSAAWVEKGSGDGSVAVLGQQKRAGAASAAPAGSHLAGWYSYW